MWNINKKVPISVAALCVVSLFGLKDTGIFISDHVQTTYSGNKVFFETGEKAEIVENVDGGYIVSKGKAKVTIPEEKIKLAEKTIETYKVIKNTSIKSEDKILRNLFIGEDVKLVKDNGETYLVKTSDNLLGEVAKESLEFLSKTTEEVDYKNSNIVKINNISKEEKIIEEVAANSNINKVQINKNTKNTVKVEKNNSHNSKADIAVDSALDKLGSTYVYGDTGKSGYDCSGLVYAVYKNQLGINLPRSSSQQSNYGTQIAKDNLQKGDLIFFNTSGSGVSHVGIYMGNDEFVHASSGKGEVMVSKLTEKYYQTRYVNATRVL
ncbi:MAG: C40 family peptidase [Peptoniphilaceae bacterium]